MLVTIIHAITNEYCDCENENIKKNDMTKKKQGNLGAL